MKKPLPVKIVEAIGWVYVAFAVLLMLRAIIELSSVPTIECIYICLCSLVPTLLAVGMLVSLRRRRRGWFVVPNTMVLSLLVAGLVLDSLDHASDGTCGDRPRETVVKAMFARSWIFCSTRDHEIMVKYMQMKAKSDSVARLSSKADYTIFSYGGKSIRFAAPYSLRRYLRVTKWHDGYMEVEADYGAGAEEDYIDLRPVLRNLMIDPKRFLKSVKKVEVSYA